VSEQVRVSPPPSHLVVAMSEVGWAVKAALAEAGWPDTDFDYGPCRSASCDCGSDFIHAYCDEIVPDAVLWRALVICGAMKACWACCRSVPRCDHDIWTDAPPMPARA